MTNHTIISFIKSAFRIVGLLVVIPYLPLGILLLIIAEILGVAEEIWM